MGGFFAKAIGALYKIPLTNILGSGGMGLYYLVFPVYSLVITLCSSGVSVAVSTEVAKCRKVRHRYNEQKILQVAIVMSFILSVLLTIIVIISSKFLSEAQGNINASIGYIAIAPAIILSSIIATIRGYFQGIENMVPTTISLIIEQVIKLSLGLVLAKHLVIYGINYAVLGAILGVTLSEVVAMIIIVINFITYKGQLHFNYRVMNFRRNSKVYLPICIKKVQIRLKGNHSKRGYFRLTRDRQRYTLRDAFKKLIKIALPSTLSALIIPISTMLDSFMVINILVEGGMSLVTATKLYGIWGGIVQSLISIPIIITSAIATSLVPSLSGLVVHNDTNEITHRIRFFIKVTWIISIFACIVVFVFSDGLITFLYGDGLVSEVIDEISVAVNLLKFSSISIIYSAFLQTNTAILQTISRADIPFYASLISLPIRMFFVEVLIKIPTINIYGVVIANTIFLSIINIILVMAIKNKVNLKYHLYNHLIKPMLLGLVLIITMSLLYRILSNIINYILAMILLGIIMILIYGFFIYFGSVLDKKEKGYMSIKKKKISKKLP